MFSFLYTVPPVRTSRRTHVSCRRPRASTTAAQLLRPAGRRVRPAAAFGRDAGAGSALGAGAGAAAGGCAGDSAG